MEYKIISIDISPENQEEINENAGVMWEHNATTLVFNIAPVYVGDYRYYIEYRSLMGTKVRTEYLSLDNATNTVTYDIPVTMSSLKGVECYFNIVKINDDGQTIQVIKPKKFCLDFDYSADVDNSIAKVNDFSINALLEAIRSGSFKGEKGEKGNQGEKGDSGEITNLDNEMSDESEKPVQNKVIKKYIDDKKEIKKITEECNAWELPEGLYIIDRFNNDFVVTLDNFWEYSACEGMLFIINSALGDAKIIYACIIDNENYEQRFVCLTVNSEGTIVEDMSSGYFATEKYVDARLSALESTVADLTQYLKK